MTAALPRASLPVGRPGTIVKNRGTEPAGHTPIVTDAPDYPAEAGEFHLYPAAGSVCKGDSGSGVFEIVNGRATVVGVGSTAVVDSQTDCLRAGGEVGVSDVFSYRRRIYATMGMNTILRNLGGGTFGGPEDDAIGPSPAGIAFTDLNDGDKIDIPRRRHDSEAVAAGWV